MNWDGLGRTNTQWQKDSKTEKQKHRSKKNENELRWTKLTIWRPPMNYQDRKRRVKVWVGAVSSRSVDIWNSMIYWSRWSVDLIWMIEHWCYHHPYRWSCLLLTQKKTQQIIRGLLATMYCIGCANCRSSATQMQSCVQVTLRCSRPEASIASQHLSLLNQLYVDHSSSET